MHTMHEKLLVNNSLKIAAIALAAWLLQSASFTAAMADNMQVINADGKTVIPPGYSIEYLKVGAFAVTNSAAESASKKKYVFDLNGNPIDRPVPEPVTDQVLPEGYSPASNEDGFLLAYGHQGTAVFTSSGRQIIPLGFNVVQYLGEHMFSASKFGDTGATNKFLIDSSGATVCKLPDWAWIGPRRRFHEGLLNIGEDYINCVFINKLGKVAFKCDYPEVGDFADGLCTVRYRNRDGKDLSGFINHLGKMIIGPFKDACLYPFANGLASITRSENGVTKAGVLNKSGKFVIPLEFDTISGYPDGTFLAAKGGRFILLNRKAQVLIKFPANCTTVQLPLKVSKDTLIPCGFGGTVDRKKYIGKLGSKWSYCDTSGKIVFEPRFSYCTEFVGDRAVAWAISHDDEQLTGVIDKKGNWIIEPKYQWIQIATSDRFIVCSEPTKSEDAWKEVGNRYSTFAELLRKYQFIGMQHAELQRIFGEPGTSETPARKTKGWTESISYDLTPGASCGNACTQVEFGLDQDGRVFGWRAAGGSMQDCARPWITEDVTIESTNKGLILGNLAPKPR